MRVPACPVERAPGGRGRGGGAMCSREIPSPLTPACTCLSRLKSTSLNIRWFVPCQLSVNGLLAGEKPGVTSQAAYSGAHTALVSLSKRSDGEHHPSGLWADCGFACEHLLDNEEPGGETAISEPFVIFPTGQKLI